MLLVSDIQWRRISQGQGSCTGGGRCRRGDDAIWREAMTLRLCSDGDGKLDLVSGEEYGTFKYFRNTGTSGSPRYSEITGASNPFNGIDVGQYSSPALGDVGMLCTRAFMLCKYCIHVCMCVWLASASSLYARSCGC